MSTNPEDDAPYIPERYRLQIQEKNRRRIIRRFVIGGIAIAILAVIVFLAVGPMFTGVPGKNSGVPPAPTPSASVPSVSTVSPTPSAIPATITPTLSPVSSPATAATSPVVTATRASAATNEPVISPEAIAAQQIPGVILIDKATAYLHEDYPASAYRLISINVTDTTIGMKLWLFSIKPVGSASADPATVVEMDANTGDFYSPVQESARITSRGVKTIVGEAFVSLHPDKVRVRFVAGKGNPAAWNFSLYSGDSIIVSGSLDPNTGQITSFARNLASSGRPVAPVLDITAAQKTADGYLAETNGPVSVNLTISRYDPLGTPEAPVAGQYFFHYNRVVQGYPCDVDGFSVVVDSVSGEVNAYTRTWNTPEYSFVASPQPVVLRRDATYEVLKKAQDTYPGLSQGVRIISAEIRWKDDHPATVAPRPGGVPLAWKVVFDDELMRQQPGSVAVAWIDVQTGNMLEFDYRN